MILTKVDTDDPDYVESCKEEMKKEPVGSDALERVLYHVGEMGRYQKLMFLSMLPFALLFTFIYFGQMFITATPQQHWCHVPELAHLDMETRRNLSVPRVGDGWAQCEMYAANWSLVLDAMQPPEPSTPKLPCQHGWDFLLRDIPYQTVVSERGWVCEYSGYAPFAQTMYFVGSFTGGILFGWAADHFGRVPALVGANLIACVGGLGTIFTKGLWDFVFCRFLVGMAFDNSFTWLASRGKVNQAVKVLKKFERINRTKVPQDVMDDFIVSSSQSRESSESIIEVFKSAPLRKMMLLLMVIYMGCAMIFDGLVRMSEGLGVDFFLAFTLASATQIPSVGIVALLLDRLGRRNFTMGPIIMTGIFTITAAFVPKGLPQMILAIGSRFSINMACTASVQWSTELVPTGARASGLSLVHVSGYVGNMLSPLIVYSTYSKHQYTLTVSSFCFLLPETKGRSMPQTIADGERVMRSHTLCGKAEEETDLNEKEKTLIT
ncbi:Solute carrier family 22 member 3 [Papilio machaon]|uniref:Solute carrier family 22 member 3 n=1 Tax=Papilio machaon TaxID=76193 RepID=A0A194RJ30_PAPMA|nr:Solute carrier family 22 member 3 [Papilio machaon]